MLGSATRLLLLGLLSGLAWGLPPANGAACMIPKGEWITGADLATAVPIFAALPPDFKVGYAPTAGLVRVFHPDELRRLAHAHGLSESGLNQNLCAAWPLAPLQSDSLRSAMEKVFEGRSPQIEILARSNADAPAGEVVFPLDGLTAYSENPVIWKGYVVYAGNRHFDTWASVRVRVKETHLEANGAIHAGDRLTRTRWREETYVGPPLRTPILSGLTAEGMVARHDLADGAPLLAAFFETPKAVERGDMVTVVSDAGGARIEAIGEALEGGRCGDVIRVRNPRSQKTFRARIASAGQVQALPGTSTGLAGSDSNERTSL